MTRSSIFDQTPETANKRELLAQRLQQAANKPAGRPLSFAQQRLWFLEQLDPNRPVYNVPVLVRLTGTLDIALLEQSLDTIIARHESLRTRFTMQDDEPVQIIDAHGSVKISMMDLSRLSEAKELQARQIISEEANLPFDLNAGRLLRATLIRQDSNQHLLLVVMHHIVSDEWSLKVLFRELSEIYTALYNNQKLQFPEISIQYQDFSQWQREWMAGPVLDQQLAYWKEQLRDAPPVLELLPDNPRKKATACRGARISHTFSPELSNQIKQLANQENATLFMVLLAGFNALLYRYTQQEDIIISSPIAGRNRIETENLIGFFVNTLLLRTRLSGGLNVKELIARCRDTALGAYAHQDLPFERLVEELQPERAIGHVPFTNIMFAVQNSVVEELRWPGLTLEFLDIESRTTKFDATLVVQETTRGLISQVEYNSDLFDADTMYRLLGHFEVLLQSMVSDPTYRLSELTLLCESERKQLLFDWNQTTTKYPRAKTVHELFEDQVEKNPDATAIVFGRQSLTYAELNSRSNQLAHHLRQFGVGPDVPVAICVQRSVEMVVGVLAILKAGGTYVPMDADYPPERLAFMLQDTLAPVVLTQQSLLSRLPTDAPKIICLDGDWEFIGRESRQNPVHNVSPEHLAYVMYTSGSTGTPKGAAVPHRAITRLVLNTNYVELTSADRIAQVSNFSFDAATFEIWGALLNGGQLIFVSREIALSPQEFALELKQQQISAIFLTSALFTQLANEAPGAFQTVRNLIAGGEALDPKAVRSVLADRPPERLVNGYGPTENTTFTCCHLIRELAPDANNVPIGRPISNTQVYILDQHLNPVPIGVPGELYAGGDGVARGYWNRSELTDEAFIPNPFVHVGPRQPLYKTGDLARYRADGTLEFLGRIDSQVKIRGFRIELGEIEATLNRHPAVRECVVVLREGGAEDANHPSCSGTDLTACASSDKRLAAYFVVEGSESPTVSELRGFLRALLPEFMIPTAFVRLEALPLTANGKVNRKALPAPDQERPSLEPQYVSPRDNIEKQLAGIWESVLKVQPIGIHDKFFDLGGHSLLAVRMSARIERVLGKRIRVASIFEGPTIAQLAALIREEQTEPPASATSILQIQSKGTRPPLFLVHGAGGGMFWGYVNLAKYLGTDQPVYGFKSRGLDGVHGLEEFDRIEDLAAQYVQDLRKVQPHGPYYLGGYCFGGNVAYEMARQLSEGGEDIAMLALLNCAPPNSRYTHIRFSARWLLRFGKNLFYWLNYFSHWTPPQRREFFRWKWNRLKSRLTSSQRRLATGPHSRLDARDLVDLSAFSTDEQKVWEAHIRALINFHPKPFNGHAHLFRSPGHPLWCSFDPDYGWNDLARGSVSIQIVPGAHEKILAEPCVKEVAAKLRECLQNCTSESRKAEQTNITKEKTKAEQREANAGFESNGGFDRPGIKDSTASLPHTNSNGNGSRNSAQIAFNDSRRRSNRLSDYSNGHHESVAFNSNGKPGGLSFVQQRVWFLDQLESAHPVYTILSAIRLEGPLNQKALEQSLGAILDRHEVLRSVFPSKAGAPSVAVQPEAANFLRFKDLSALTEQECQARIAKLIHEEKCAPFKIAQEIPFRALLVRTSPRQHLLIVVIHEIAADATSFEILFRELASLYSDFCNNQQAVLRNLPLQYADFASWQQEQIDERQHRQELEFWKRNLAGAPALLELPTDLPRPANQSHKAALESRSLSPALVKELHCYTERHNTSEFIVALASLKALLSRYARQDDVLVATTVINREAAEFTGLIGNFANLLVLRTDLSDDPTAGELLERVRRNCAEGWRNQSIPFKQLLDELKPGRDQSYHPVCQVSFTRSTRRDAGGLVVANNKTSGVPFGTRTVSLRALAEDLSMSLLDMEQGTTQFDLNFEIAESTGGPVARVEYATDLFLPETIRRMLGHWEMLMQGILCQPNVPLSELSMLTREEENLLLVDWTRTEKSYPRDKTLINLFEEQVARTPDAEALIAGETRLTYRELRARALAVSKELRSLGAGHESLVGICLERSWELIAAILGALHAGAAYVPLDPAYPKERLAAILEDAKVSVLITQEKLKSVVPQTGAKLLEVESVNWPRANQAQSNFHCAELRPTSLAYVIYTSGSTGQPKGVGLEHRNAVAFVSWAREVFSQDDISGVLASTSICFDLSIFEFFVPLSWGGKIILAENALALPTLPAVNEVKLINSVPSAMRELLRLKAVPPSVRVVNLAGEPLATPLVNEIYAQTTTERVYDLYGPTETTTYSTYTLREPNKRATIGKPLANEQVYLLNRAMRPVPIGVPGDLYIGGAGVTRGYLNRPDLTAERYISNPFKPGTRMYKTGDLARWRPDGNLEFLGRSDYQVKVRGFRIELGEVEIVLKKCDAVREAVVMAREDNPGDKRLVAYVVPHTGLTPAPDELRAAVRKLLPDYMTPSAFVILPELPLTPNGKVDRKALPAPDQDSRSSGTEFVAPRSEAEEQLAGIFREVLNLPRVGVFDSFFDLGGHSLLAVQAISRIREQFAIELPLFSLFDAPRISALAEGLSSGRWAPARQAAVPIKSTSRQGAPPVSFVQERLWFLDQLEPGSHAYNVPCSLRIQGELDLSALGRALDAVIRRHESLRTTFAYEDGRLSQAIAPPATLELRLSDLRTVPADTREAQAAQFVTEQAHEPFDLAKGPLIRASLVQLGDVECILTVVMHHTVSDGWSLTLFFKELASLYQSYVSNADSTLPELPIQYADYAQWQRGWMQNEVLDRELAFWREQLAGAPSALDIPTDFPDLEKQSGKAGRAAVQFSPKLAGDILNTCQRDGLTPFMVLMSALSITLHQWTKQQDMVIGTVVAGRNRRELENVIGCFMNFLPIRASISGSDTGQQILSRLRATILESQSHQDCPFEKVVEAINPQRRLNKNPLYNIALLLQNFPAEPFSAPGLQAVSYPVAMEAALLDLRFEAELKDRELSIVCEYKTDLFRPDTIDYFLKAFQQVLSTLTTQAESRIEEFPGSQPLNDQAATARTGKKDQTIAITATFTAEPVADALRYWAAELGLSAGIEFAPYNQVFQQLLDPQSLLSTNSSGLNVIFLRLEDWLHSDDTSHSQRNGNDIDTIKRNADEFVKALRTAAERNSTPILACICPVSKAVSSQKGTAEQFSRLEEKLIEKLEKISGVYALSRTQLATWYPVGDYDDPSATELGHVPYTPVAFTALGTAVARKFQALQRSPFKVIVLDCDNTLWSGVCGEDGPAGIRIDPPRKFLQEFMWQQHDSGMLLCMCSKNSEQDVEQVFRHRCDMPLRRAHFVAARLNWTAKSENLKALARELGLGLDSFIFVDDNPVECAEVSANCPEVMTLLLPEDASQIPQFLNHCWVFDHLKFTSEDRQRTELYRQNQQREQLRAETMSLAEFLAGLDLKIEISAIGEEDLSRVSQLTQRTNQFNFTTLRYTEADLKNLLPTREILKVHVKDRFGDYGLTGLMIFGCTKGTLGVDTFLLSCRVLGRGVEHAMLARLGQIARERNLKHVHISFLPTDRNKPASDFLEKMCANRCDYRQNGEHGALFDLPVEFASEVRFDCETHQVNSSPAAESATRPKAAASARNSWLSPSQCREIALISNCAASIHDKMEAKSFSKPGVRTGYVAPSTDLERDLCQLWQRLLHIERVGIRQNFFELGGHSLLAVRLFAEVEKITGHKFPLVTLFQAPTIEKLAEVLSQSGSSSPYPLIVGVQPSGSKPPLILVHGAGGDVLWGYANLAAHLPPDQPVYGIKSRGQTGVEDFRKIEDMANWYVQQLRAFQPHGPYYLGGYCFGGNVAYEMARKLKAEGEEIALLALLDTAPANAGYERIPWWQPSYLTRFARNFTRWLDDFLKLEPAVRRSFIRRKARTMSRKLRNKLSFHRQPEAVDLEDVIEFSHFPEHELKLWQIHLEALVRHQQQPYDGEIVLLRTRGQPLFCSLEEDFCWKGLVPSVRIKVVPGSHEDIFVEPNVKALATELQSYLSESQARYSNAKP